MKFLAVTLIVHRPDPITGVHEPTHDRFREVLDNALLAEELGFDGFGAGERHGSSAARRSEPDRVTAARYSSCSVRTTAGLPIAADRVQGNPCHNLVNSCSQHAESAPGILDRPDSPLL